MKESNTSQGQDNTAKDADQSKNEGTGSKSVTTGSKSAPTTNETDDPDNSNNPSKTLAWLKKHVTATLVVELLVLLVGIKVACIYSHQLDQMIRQNQIATKSQWLDQRAWVTPIATQSVDFNKFNQPITFSIRLENTGRSPAEKIGGHASFLVYRKGIEDSLVHPRDELSSLIDGGVLNPNSHITISIPPAVYSDSEKAVVNTPKFAASVASGDMYLLLHGKVKYVDAWKVDHWIQFCNVIGKAFQEHPACTEYNQIDHNEPPQ
jgi:hypothetical protein